MLNHNSECLVTRTLLFLRELSNRCTEFVKSFWSDCLQRDIEALRYSPNEELRSVSLFLTGFLIAKIRNTTVE